jgi:predicted nucleic acid-binding protein
MKSSTISDRPTLFIDTWGWLVLADKREPDHLELAVLQEAYEDRQEGWVTSDYVLDETITRIFARRPFDDATRSCERILRARDTGILRVERITPERFQAAYSMRLLLDDKPRISFTDLTSMCIMRELGLRHVVTHDNHFQQIGLGFIALP